MRKLLILCLVGGFPMYSYAAYCGDFSTQQEAQKYMERTGDTHFDGDNDGEACECLPGGSKHGSKVCRRYLKSKNNR